jgi:hypothetical protein
MNASFHDAYDRLLASYGGRLPPPGYEARMKKLRDDQKVEETVEVLKTHGFKVLVRHRKLAKRKKTYLVVRGPGGNIVYRDLVMPIIREHFPDAYMTSGGFGVPYEGLVHFPHLNLTIALTK